MHCIWTLHGPPGRWVPITSRAPSLNLPHRPQAKDGIKQCTCGGQRHQELRAHEGAPNHNLLPRGGGGRAGGGAPAMPFPQAFGAAMRAAGLNLRAVHMMLARGPMGGGGHHFDDDDDEDDDVGDGYW